MCWVLALTWVVRFYPENLGTLRHKERYYRLQALLFSLNRVFSPTSLLLSHPPLSRPPSLQTVSREHLQYDSYCKN